MNNSPSWWVNVTGPSLDVTAFTAALKQAMTCERRNTLGERARTTLRPYTPEATAEGVRRAVRLAREMNGKR